MSAVNDAAVRFSSYSARKSSRSTHSGVRSPLETSGPDEYVSYCWKELQKPWPSVTRMLPSYPQSLPPARPSSSATRERWNSRLPVSLR